MLKKILVAEDIDSITVGVISVLKNITDATIDHVRYCDDALLKLRKAEIDQEPYDLLITDLSFKQDHRIVNLSTGDELIAAIKKENYPVKIIAFSIEDRSYRIKSLLEMGINAYVVKGRSGSAELTQAVKHVANSNEKFISSHLQHLLTDPAIMEITDDDVDLLKYLALGLNHDEISVQFKQLEKRSSSLSSIEKRVNKLKIYFKAKNTSHLVGIAKDMGII